jgi:hypothetical protein
MPSWRDLSCPDNPERHGASSPQDLGGASHEVPGFGAPALPSALGLGVLRPPRRIARERGVPHPAGGGYPASAATATLLANHGRDAVISTHTGARKGPESCRLG